MMVDLAIIGGTGLDSLKGLKIVNSISVNTPYGEPSAPLSYGEIAGRQILFLPRHGDKHTIPPHKINYRANIWALKNSGAKKVIAVNAVGAIHRDMTPGKVIIPDQIIDYTHSRIGTFFEEGLTEVTHIDFTWPYCQTLREEILQAATQCGLNVFDKGVYAATQGPRLESAAEIKRLERDGCDLVGMTAMPEAALAKELDLCYAAISVVANMAAGIIDEEITMEMIERYLKGGMEDVRKLLETVIVSV